MEIELREKIMKILLRDNKKEFVCHIQFVMEIGMRLAKDNNADLDIVEVACLLHDIGRGKELADEQHPQTSKRIAEELLIDSSYFEDQKEKIFACILSHGAKEIPATLEEQIVRTADGGSKVEYHEAFMLLCKKETYEERLAWGVKYLEKGYCNLSLDAYKKEVEQKYISINETYKKMLKMI